MKKSRTASSARVSARASMRSAGSAQANVRSAWGTAADAGRHKSNPDRSTAGVRGAGKSRPECGVQCGNRGVPNTSNQFINNNLHAFCWRQRKTAGRT